MKKSIRLIDVASGRECLRITIASSYPRCLCFSPDGKRLVSGLYDSTALIWDVSDLPKRAPSPPPGPQEPKELAARWAILQGNAEAAHRASVELVAAGDVAARYLGKQLAKGLAPDSRRLTKLIRDLDDDVFATREAAMKELREWGLDVDEALHRALANHPSLEQKRRISRLLAVRKKTIRFSEEVRALRAIAVLERIGSPAAQTVLRTLATGPPDAPLAQEAKASLTRLSITTAPHPNVPATAPDSTGR